MPTTETSVAIFSYIGQDVRVVMIDDVSHWVATDVAAALGLVNGRDAVSRLDEAGVGTTDIRSGGQMRRVTVINEGGLYELIFQSRRPEAREFRRWVTQVVLPELRQKGTYSVAPAGRALPQDFASALREFAAEVEAHEETKAALEVAAPRAEAWNAIASAEGDYSVGDAAKILARAGIATGPTRLFRQLAEIKWTYRGADGRPRAYADRVEKGYLSEKPSFHYHPGTGERVVDPPQVRVTVKGIDRLRQRLHASPLKAVTA